MKAKIKNEKKEKEFVPFTIELTVETLDEAKDLWHRFNLAHVKLPFGNSDHLSKPTRKTIIS